MFTTDSIVLHIPHSSTYLFPGSRDLFFPDDAQLRRELLRMTDLYTDDLFGLPLPSAVFPVSRLLCDVERFRDPDREEMTRQGMWVCYEKTSGGQPLKHEADEHKARMLRLYDLHHRKLTGLIDEALERTGECLLIDCHSFSSRRLPYEIRAGTGCRPDICIGENRRFHRLGSDYFEKAFQAKGYRVGHNDPFAGALVPEKYYEWDYRVASVMIEVNRALYMDEETGEKNGNYDRVKADIRDVILNMPDMENPVREKKPPEKGFVVISFESEQELAEAFHYLTAARYANPYHLTPKRLWGPGTPGSIVLCDGVLTPLNITCLAAWAGGGYRPVSFPEFLAYYDDHIGKWREKAQRSPIVGHSVFPPVSGSSVV